tara:strand:+ start:638 stop:826 length:189 start_codon:yes stop_codon:yes gene_type:complete
MNEERFFSELSDFLEDYGKKSMYPSYVDDSIKEWSCSIEECKDGYIRINLTIIHEEDNDEKI